ncbi:MAG TPA: aminotransferase, partial [Chitinophagaceae bacterium]|nr:aminotransferase [Chitinophagaceae bacterium]
TYGAAVQLAGATVDYYDILTVNDYQPDIHAIEKQFQAHKGKVKICFANTPHMPTGTTLQPAIASALVALCKRYHVLLVHDNPYSCILNNQPTSFLRYDVDKEVVIELNSLSKSHNMAGWRVGMVVAHETHINNILRFKSNMDSGMFLPVQLAAAKALTLDASWQQSLNEVYAKRQQIAIQIFDAMQVQYNKQQVGMFLWGQVPKVYESGYAMSNALLYNKHVFITPGGIFGSNGNNYVRISLCSNETILNQALER